jgi:hypothetical protein
MHVHGFLGVEFTYACVCTHVRTSGSEDHGRGDTRWPTSSFWAVFFLTPLTVQYMTLSASGAASKLSGSRAYSSVVTSARQASSLVPELKFCTCMSCSSALPPMRRRCVTSSNTSYTEPVNTNDGARGDHQTRCKNVVCPLFFFYRLLLLPRGVYPSHFWQSGEAMGDPR